MRDILKLRSPFFLPMSRRVFTVAACLGWGGLEYAWGNSGWSAFFVALGLYLAYEFFLIFDEKNYQENND